MNNKLLVVLALGILLIFIPIYHTYAASTIVMSDTATSFGSLISTPRQFVGEFASPTSVLVGKQIDSITLSLSKAGAPTGIAQIGVFDTNLNLVKLFGTIDVSTITVPYQNYEFELSSPNLYTIQSGDRIGFKYTGGDTLNGINVMVDRSTTGAFDGANSYRVRYESAWITSPTEDMTMILMQTGSSTPTPTVLLNPSSGVIGSTVNISGINFTPTSNVSIKFDNALQTTTPPTITTNSTGGFTGSILIPSSGLGGHSINATDAAAKSAQATFTIKSSTISLTPTTGPNGTSVSISGKGFAPNSITTIKYDSSILVTNPTVITSNVTGGFTGSILVPSSSFGPHMISATDVSTNTAQATFTVVSPNFFQDSKIVSGLKLPTAMEVAPDGRVFISEKAGNLRVVLQNGTLLATPFLTVPVDSQGERGLLGIAFDPNFNSNGFVYVYYTSPTPTIHNVVSRFTASSYNPNISLANTKLDLLSLETLGPTNHNGGSIHFGPDGKLYVAVGNNAINSNSQSLATHLGKILRINSNGTIPSDNPFFNTPGAVKEIWALGLRNPFTFAFQPGTSKMYINDVGESTWEEVNNGTSGANYGWPTCEGICSTPGMTNPIYTYNHNGAGAAIAGAAFYQAHQFPADYMNNYFFGDYVVGFIKRLLPTTPPQAVNFLTTSGPVDIRVGPDGSLYYISITKGELHKVQYITTGNHDPNAVINVNKTSGLVPLAVSFNATGSSDAENDPMTFSWDFGDGSAIQSGFTVSHIYTKDGPYTAKLSVSDGKGGVGIATIQINVGNPPTGTITLPINQTKYNAGDVISFNATGTDPDDGVLPASAFYWDIVFHHNTHTHPFLEFTGVKNGNFVIPTTGETSDNVWFAVNLKVTDSSGLINQKLVNIFPHKSNMTFVTNPTGLKITVDGIPQTTPTSIIGVVGMTRTLGAPTPQVVAGTTYNFKSWSDGLAAIHDIITPSTNSTYTATFGP